MPSGVYERKKSAIQRFEEKYKINENGCWVWIGASSKSTGYGTFHFSGKRIGPHVFSYKHFIGPMPEKMVIDHLCRNPACVNPAHLECVTMAENTARGYLQVVKKLKAQMQTHCKRGHPLSGDNLIISKTGRCCKACQRHMAEEWRKKNKRHVNEMQRKRRKNSDAEKLKIYKEAVGIK